MKVTAILVSAFLLLTDVVVARPSRLQERIARRQRTSRPIIRASPASTSDLRTSNTDASHVEYSQNWAGVVIEEPPSGKFTSVTGTFVVPALFSSGAASAWVGIDGDTATNSILQAGVDFEMDQGRTSYAAWLEWYPNYAVDISDFPVSVGETITVTIKATSSTAGTVTLTNESTGRRVTQAVRAPDSSAALQGLNAEWIVEDFEEGGSLVEFANFGSVTFYGASADLSTGKSIGVSNGQIVDIEQNGKVLTSVIVSSDSSVAISYI